MTDFEVYKMYLALKQHFTKEEYHYFKYQGAIRASETSYYNRSDRYFFKKLATKYSRQEIMNYLVANFLDNPKGYIKTFNKETYERWKIYQESFTYKFREDIHLLLNNYSSPYQDKFDRLFDAVEGVHPVLLKQYYSGEVSLETLVVLEECLGYVKNFDKVLTDPIWKDTKNKIVKYQPFLNLDCSKFRQEVLTVIRTKL